MKSFFAKTTPEKFTKSWLLPTILVCLPFAAYAGKKGVAIDDVSARRIASLNVGWYFNWKLVASANTNPGCFVPMFWGKRDQIKQLPVVFSGKSIPNTMLVYNEPEYRAQSNRSVEEIVSEWPTVASYTKRISSPNVARMDNYWLDDFMAEASRKRLKVDFVAIHWYGGPDSKRFLKFVDDAYKKYRLPVWITEFAVADWKSAKYGTPNRYTESDVIQFMNEVIPELERRSYVEKYAWLAAKTTKESLRSSFLFDVNGNMTQVGKAYSNFQITEQCK